MSYLRQVENLAQNVSITGQLYGKPAAIYPIMGRRAGFTSTSVLNDVKEFDNGVASIPILSLSALDIISSSASDTNTAGTGVRQVKVTYLNNLNVLTESPAINLNGTTLVTNVLTNVNAVLWMESTVVGSGAAAAGDIRLRINGGVVEVEQISAGGNRSLSARFMVPAGYSGYITAWRGSAINNDQDIRLQATVNSLDRTLSSVYHFQSTLYLPMNTALAAFDLQFLKLPALSRIKVSTFSGAVGAAVRCDTNLYITLIQD